MHSPLGATLKRLGSTLSPAARRYRRFLNSLPLRPDALAGTSSVPGSRDTIICGSPRTGTTLAAGWLWQPPHVVTVMEPWDGMRLHPGELFASLRREITETGVLGRGRLNVPVLLNDHRVTWCRDGEIPVAVETAKGYVLAVKWPTYWHLIDHLPETKFIICLRHPYQVVRSYRRTGGRLALGFEYHTPFNRAMNDYLAGATHDPATRRVLLFDYIHERLIRHLNQPNVLALRYEEWFRDPERQTKSIANFLGADLSLGPVKLRPPPDEPRGEDPDRPIVQRLCRTAESLGYELF